MKIYLIALLLLANIASADPQDIPASAIGESNKVEGQPAPSPSAGGNHEVEGLRKSKQSISNGDPLGSDLNGTETGFVGFNAWLLKLVNDPIALFTLVLAIYTIQLSRTTTRLWIEAKSSGKTADESALAAKLAAEAAKHTVDAYMMAERAWVSVVDIQPVEFQNAVDRNNQLHNGTQFNFRWKNTGKTPARDVILFSSNKVISLQDGEPSFKYEGTEINVKQGVLFPESLVTSVPQQFEAVDIERLKKREIRIFMYGYARYFDVYGSKDLRHTEVCVEVLYDGLENGRSRFVFMQSTSQNSVL